MKITYERMTVVGESNETDKPPKEQVPKRPLEQISQVDGTTTGRTSGESVYSSTPPKGKTLLNNGVKLSGKRTEKGRACYATLFCSFFACKKRTEKHIVTLHYS